MPVISVTFSRTEPLQLRVFPYMTIPFFSIKLESTYRAEDSSGEELSPPSGFCFSNEGYLLLADDFNHRVQVYDSQSNLSHSFGSKGKEPGQFQYPKGIAVDSIGNIYVADCWNHRVQKFDSKGTHLFSFGSCGDGKGELNEPYDILVEPSGNLIVVERYNHRIQFFDPQGISMGWLGDRGTVLEEQLAELQGTPKNLLAPPLFELPTSIAKDSHGNYFITDSGNHRIRKFNSQWQEVTSFGEKGSEPGQFEYPLCVTVAPNDLLYIADLNNERVQVFSPFGQYLFAIDEASTGQDFAAPCLTAIDLKGCLHIGFTFSTQIYKCLLPLVSQNTLAERLSAPPNPNPAHTFYQALVSSQENNDSKALTVLENTLGLLSKNESENESSNLKLNVALELSKLSKRGTILDDKTFALACNLAEENLKKVREKVLQCFLSWQKLALRYAELLYEEQRVILKDPDGVRDFNREVYIAEQEDKKHYILTRNEFFSYRKTVEQFSRFICNSIESKLPKTQLALVNNLLVRQTGETLNLIKEYFGKKEKSEESMVQLLGESQGEKDKLSAFLTQYYSNERIMDLQQNLQFELQSHWLNIRALTHNTNVSLESYAGNIENNSSSFENILKSMVGFHENWVSYPQLEQQFLNSLDTISRNSQTSEQPDKTDLTLSDLAPIPYDTENLNFSGFLNAIMAETSPIYWEKDSLIWGENVFHFLDFSNQKEELACCAQKLMETQATYQEKYQELTHQLEEILCKRNDLDVQLKQTKVEDKVSPITINENIAIVQFQINLIRRMILSLGINQSINLHRLVLAGAFLSLVEDIGSESQRFFKDINDFSSQQDQQIRNISKSCKEYMLKIASLAGQASELDSKYEISKISNSAKVEDENTRAHVALELCEFEFQRESRIKSILDKLIEFRARLLHTENSPKSVFREKRILEKTNVSIGQTLTLHGIHHNQDGNLFVVSREDHRVYSYSPEGICQFYFGEWGNASEKLQYPSDLTIDSKGCIYVIEEKTRRIKKFNKEGTYLLQFCLSQSGTLYSPSIDDQDNLWVADPEHNQIWVVDGLGKTLKTLHGKDLNFKEPVSVHCLPNGEYLVGDKSEFILKHFDSNGNMIQKADRADWGVDEIYFMTWHPRHGIYGSDFWNGQIVHFNNKLEVQKVYWKPGRRTGQFGKVAGLSILNNQLAVANYDGCKVQIFDLSS